MLSLKSKWLKITQVCTSLSHAIAAWLLLFLLSFHFQMYSSSLYLFRIVIAYFCIQRRFYSLHHDTPTQIFCGSYNVKRVFLPSSTQLRTQSNIRCVNRHDSAVIVRKWLRQMPFSVYAAIENSWYSNDVS